MARFRLLLAYDGSDFHGWQRQEPPGLEPLRTVQGVLTDAVSDLFSQRINVDGASRTDAGVHAHGQVAAFTVDSPRIPTDRIAMALNTRLPGDVEVRDARSVSSDFDPVRSCVSKGYHYRLRHGSAGRPPSLLGRSDPFERATITQVRAALDPAKMRTAASAIVGTHDFRAFAHNPDERDSTVRSVHAVSVVEPGEGLVRIEVSGSGFLHHMIRIMVGTLVEVGRGRIPPDEVARIIASRERSNAGPTMPPQGLCLGWIHYGGRDAPAPIAGEA